MHTHILKQKMGRPRTRNREISEAILSVLSTHCRWEELPPCFPLKMTVFDRFKVGQKDGFFEVLFKQFKQKKQEVQEKTKEIYTLDATIKSAKKGDCVGRAGKLKGTKLSLKRLSRPLHF
ncbi:MAG: transposase [Vampirovibrio sp.]